MTDKTEAQPEALRLEVHQECAEFATSLRSAANTVQLEGKKVPLSFLRAADLFERAAAELRRQHTEIDRLRALAATCYAGLGGECDLPVIWLDALNDAANGEPFDTDGLLPYMSAIRAQLTTQTNRAAAAEQQVTALTQRLDMAKPMQMIECKCGDSFDIDSYNAGFTDAAGKCPNCDAAETASRKLTQQGELPPLGAGVYELNRLADLIKVPIHRRSDCVHELLLALELLEFATGAEAEPELVGPLIWRDDGITSVDLTLRDGKLTLTEEKGEDA